MSLLKRNSPYLLISIMLVALAEVSQPHSSASSGLPKPDQQSTLVGSNQGSGLIAFEDMRDRNNDIYVAPVACASSLTACSSKVKQLTDDPAFDFDPVWSPDGQWLAFTSNRDIDQEIYVIRPDGRGLSNLTRNEAADMSPDWSPDGTRMAFVSNRDGTHFDGYVMDLRGGDVTRLTNMGSDVEAPAWLRDGKHISFLSDADRHLVYVVDVACAIGAQGEIDKLASCTTPGPQLTDGDLLLRSMALSPTDNRIAFTAAPDDSSPPDLYLFDPDKPAKPVRVVSSRGGVESPVWRLDGMQIAYQDYGSLMSLSGQCLADPQGECKTSDLAVLTYGSPVHPASQFVWQPTQSQASVIIATSVPAKPTRTPVLSGEYTRYVVVAGESDASYGVWETLINENNHTNYARGSTTAVSGDLYLNLKEPSKSRVGPITVNLVSLTSDSVERDNQIQYLGLESAYFPRAILTNGHLINFPGAYTPGETVQFDLSTELTIHNVTRPTTFAVSATLEGGRLTAKATASILMTDFGFEPPDLAGFRGVQDSVDLIVNIVAQTAPSP